MNMQDKIKCYIIAKGLKKTHIADKSGLKRDTFSNILNGKRKLLVDEYCKICVALDVPLDFFATDDQTN